MKRLSLLLLAFMVTTAAAFEPMYTSHLACKLPRADVVRRVADILARNRGYVQYASTELGSITGAVRVDRRNADYTAVVHVGADGDSIHVTAYELLGNSGSHQMVIDPSFEELRPIIAAIESLESSPIGR